ncbi:ATP-grasp domain-containing protein [Pseudenhygromyxa sp. WMMC2535]|uniref:acetyl-CoA carboxylase biotin carboxylase subunit n=1 Tax=Pseudenhygromyxa sp. WMMC2535 TaxID=2712867 RepID=UPI00155670CE|nr:biotin carboxylase N-terminal domain-containing protein [Pseudenhygromyxa sp. WMMC2535]NVB38367.1 ATP-grasp domain-containing protein [Pseudenhygromyxa sp. WMMC2535]
MAGFHRLFIANRGEVAVRIARSCDELGVTPVFGVSEADRDAPWTEGRQQVVLGPARSTLSYLDMTRVVQAARQSGCSALHPGWGFLAENPVFAALCEQHGVTFVGPPAHVMHLMGKKIPAKRTMGAAGLTLIPGSEGVLEDLDEARAVAESVGYPVLLKAQSGGGGKGMRVAKTADELEQAWTQARAEATAAFGDGRLYLEKLISGGRHVEIQIMADRYGEVVHLGERDCTVQRNHQKLIEESPAPVLDPEERARTLAAAVEATRSIGYVGAGTIEFLLDQSGDGGEAGVLRFMEMNTRLQVEHCVSEMRSGVDLVREQLLVAAGHPLSLTQDSLALRGHAIECRINAEDPSQGFRPSPGELTRWVSPALGEDLRVDTHVRTGYVVPPHYDSLLCKVISWGETRDAAADRMIRALEQLECEGVKTTVPMHLQILASEDFRANRYDTRAIPGFSA